MVQDPEGTVWQKRGKVVWQRVGAAGDYSPESIPWPVSLFCWTAPGKIAACNRLWHDHYESTELTEDEVSSFGVLAKSLLVSGSPESDVRVVPQPSPGRSLTACATTPAVK